jgi:hypothetical protein
LQPALTLIRRSYDYDTDPEKRAETPGFYGYVPDKGRRRVVLLVLMTFNGATMLLTRCLGAALLMLTNKFYLFGFFAVDQGMYLGYKVARGDFDYWMPVDGGTGLFLSLLMRVIVKNIADFTGVVQFRAPGEMGGLYFTVNAVLCFALCFAALKVYFASEVGKVSELNEDFATSAFFGLFGFWVLMAALFASLIKREYWGTFVGLETGTEWATKFFLEGKTDKAKSKTVRLNKKKWRRIRGAVKDWVREGWWKWKEDKPEWFTDTWISKLPDDFIPGGEDRGALQQLRRKSSIFGGDKKRLSLGGGATIAPMIGAEEVHESAGGGRG